MHVSTNIRCLMMAACFVGFAFRLIAGDADTTARVKPDPLPSWTLFVPGAAYFHQGSIAKGLTFAVLQAGGVYAGIRYNESLKNNNSSAYYNYPLLLGLQAYNTEKLAWFRIQLATIHYFQPDFRYHDLSDKNLYLSPFKPENIFTPITGGMLLLAAVYLGIEKYHATTRIRDVERMYFIDRYIGKGAGLGAFGGVSMGMSWSAGVVEEYMLRNYLMPVLDYRLGQRKGLIYSSLIFGSLHMGNMLLAERPDVLATLFQSVNAAVLGYFLGRDVQRRGYDIGPAVAAHTWYNFALMLGSFLINPDDNVFGVSVTFKLGT